MARSYVDSILDAAAMASRQDTLGDMLNQLPGLLVEQERYRDQQQKEAERYNEELTFRNNQYQDNLDRQKRTDEMTLLGLTQNMSPDMTDTFLEGVDVESSFGIQTRDALKKSNKVRVNNIKSITTELNNLYNVDVSKMTQKEIMEMKQSVQSKIYSDPYTTKQYGSQLNQVDSIIAEKFSNDFIRTFVDDNQSELGLTDKQIQSIKGAKNSTQAFNIIEKHIEQKDFDVEDFNKISNAYYTGYNARKNVAGVVEETAYDKNMQAILSKGSEKLAKEQGVDVYSFSVPEGSYELPSEQLESLEPGQQTMEDNGVQLNITYSSDGSQAYVTPLKDGEVVNNEKESGGVFSNFGFKGSRAMPESQRRTNLNIINNDNISPSSSNYKRAYLQLEQAGLLPENSRKPE